MRIIAFIENEDFIKDPACNWIRPPVFLKGNLPAIVLKFQMRYYAQIVPCIDLSAPLAAPPYIVNINTLPEDQADSSGSERDVISEIRQPGNGIQIDMKLASAKENLLSNTQLIMVKRFQ